MKTTKTHRGEKMAREETQATNGRRWTQMADPASVRDVAARAARSRKLFGIAAYEGSSLVKLLFPR
jgi:hypothetical protein